MRLPTLAAETSSALMSLTGLFVPLGYVSGSPLSDSMTFNNATFASLGVTRGHYVWRSETPDGLFYVQYNLWCGSVPDGGSTVSLLGAAVGGAYHVWV